jgi:putative peptidoglycan lipid II flippase
LSVLLLPFAFFHGLSHLFAILLQARKRFAIAAVAPAIIPLSTILFLLLGYDRLGIHAMVYGVLAGSILHVAVLYLAFRSFNGVSLWKRPARHPEMRAVVRESIPLIAGGGVMYGAVIVDSAMASWLEAGSVSVLGYGAKVCGITLALAATSTGQVLFPFLSDQVARSDWKGLRNTLFRFTGLIVLVTAPLVAGLWLFSRPLVELLFQRGEFGAGDTQRVAEVLQIYSVQIPFYITAVLASKVVIALRASWFMLATTVVNLGGNVVFNYWLMQYFGLRGIAISTVLVYAISAAMLYAFIFWKVGRRAGDRRMRKGGLSS